MRRGNLTAAALIACTVGAGVPTAARAESFLDTLLHGGASSQAAPQPIARQMVAYTGHAAPGTIVVSLEERRLYLILPGGKAIRYGVGVGRPGFEWSGIHKVTGKRKNPDWTPPASMLARRPDLPHHMKGGVDNPLGARALYLGSSMYRIHGSNEPDTIGQAVSSGCIRMLNADIIDLYDRVKVGAKVIVLKGVPDATTAEVN